MQSIKCVGIFGSVLSLSCFYKSKYSVSNLKEKFLSYSPIKIAKAEEWIHNWDGREQEEFGGRVYHFVCPYQNPAQNERFLNDISVHIMDSRMLNKRLPLTYITSEEHKCFAEALKSRFASEFCSPDSHCSKILNNIDISFNQYEVTPQNEHENFKNRAVLEYCFKKYICRGVSSRRIVLASPNVIKFMVTRALQLPVKSWDRFDIKEGTISKLYVSKDGEVYFFHTNPFSPKLNELFKQELF